MFKKTLLLLYLSATAATTLPSAIAAQVPSYRPSRQVAGTIRIWGSPQMGDLLRLYEAGFQQLQPNVRFDNDLKSTITAVAGVYTGRAEIGLLGREIWPTEVQAFESIEGHAPVVVEIATGSYDVPKATFALMVFVHKDNPIASLSTLQLERTFGTPVTFGAQPILTWGDLGLTGEWAKRPIHLYGFSVDNDKSQIFSDKVFRKNERWNASLHEFTNTTGSHPLDAGGLIAQAVAADLDAIGLSNVFYATPQIRAVPLSRPDQTKPVSPSKENIASHRYPLTRSVYMVVNADKDHPLDQATLEFLRFVLSHQGSTAVDREGNYLALPAIVIAAQVRTLEGLAKSEPAKK